MSQGTLKLVNGSKAVVGTGTNFVNDLTAADFIVITVGGVTYSLVVASVQSPTGLTLLENFDGPSVDGAAWTAVPYGAQMRMTQQLGTDISRLMRYYLMDKNNWNAVLTGPGDVTVTLPDGTQFTGPSWPEVISQTAGALKYKGPISAGTNLNTFGSASGIWVQLSDANATSALNYPEAKGGTLEVIPTKQGMVQRYISQSNHTYVRTPSGDWNGTDGPWNAWVMLQDSASLASGNGSAVGLALGISGAAQRNLQDRAGDKLNLRDIAGYDRTGATDCTTVVQQAMIALSQRGGGTIEMSNGDILYCGSITVPQNVYFLGPNGNPEQTKPALNQSYYDMGGQIRLKRNTSIAFDRGAGMEGVLVITEGLSLPVKNNDDATTVKAQFTGTALTSVEPGTCFRNMLVLGFEFPFKGVATSPDSGRTVFENFHFDCTNGIWKEYSVDIDRFWGVHGWPYLTVHVPGVSKDNLARSGTFITLKNVADWSQLWGCFSYGYNKGVTLDSVWNCQIIGGGFDACGSVGIENIGTSRFNSASRVFINSDGFGVNVATSANPGGSNNRGFKTDHCIFNAVTYGAYVTAGTYNSQSDTCMGGTGFAFSDGTLEGSSVSDAYFDGCANPIVVTAAATGKVAINNLRAAPGQPTITITELRTAPGTRLYDPRGVAAGVGHVLEQGGQTTNGLQGYSRTGPRLTNGSPNAESADYVITSRYAGGWSDSFVVEGNGTVRPARDNAQPCGAGNYRWTTIYLGAAASVGSDRRIKKDEKKITDKVIRAWRNVELKSYILKSDGLRHFGIIAQDIITAFEAEGLDALKFGLIEQDATTGMYSVKYDEINILEHESNRRYIAELREQK